jgi:hypothetical protein
MNNARSFRSILMVASCAGAALGCYMISLRVASERSALEQVESQIVLAQRDVRTLQTEIGTRGRLAQLERWNVRVLALSAPSADQFVNGGFELARLTRPPETIQMDAPVVLAAAPAPQPNRNALADDGGDVGDIGPADGGALLHQASLKLRLSGDSPKSAAAPAPIKAEIVKKAVAPGKAAAAKAASSKPVASKTVDKKSTEKMAAIASKPVTRATRLAKADPLAPLADSKHGSTHKDSVATR